ncbi:hypothetical protein [Sporosarcina sp. FA9]|uniref:hypothetical protein n=1 Tax=Sporosarcina sp. FA9 TaxID=3413030 RepID=UPI003F655D21
MNYSVNNEELELIAKELGLKVSFDSQTPGVLNTTTKEITPLDSYFGDFFHSVNEKKIIDMEELTNMKLKTIKPKKNKKELNDFLVFTDNYNVLAG